MTDFFRGLFKKPIQRIGFEDVKLHLNKLSGSVAAFDQTPNPIYKTTRLLINTLPFAQQSCLISGTLDATKEEETINEYLVDIETNAVIIVYGANSADSSAEKKCEQLVNLGFTDVYLYGGGLFEWLLLQDVYGSAEFPTTSKCVDMLVFR